MGLLLPAVQSARETMRRSRCMNNLRQCVLGTINFESAKGHYPSGSEGSGLSPLYAILPYMELGNIYVTMDEKISPFDPPNDEAMTKQLPIFICPSDYFVGQEEGKGFTNYHANSGSWVFTAKRWDGIFGYPYEYTILEQKLPALEGLLPSSVTDGLSNTVFFAEVVNGAGNGEAPKTEQDCLEALIPPSEINTLEATQDFYLDKSISNSYISLKGSWRWRGYPWTVGCLSRTWYNHLLPPNEICWAPDNNFDILITTASSFHAASGINTALGDGSCRFINEEIDKTIWLNLGRRDDGNNVTIP